MTDFILNSVTEAAERVVGEGETMKLGPRDREVFVRALLEPEPPNASLRAAAAWYKKKVSRA